MKAIVFALTLGAVALTSCKTTQMTPTEPEKEQEMSDLNHHPRDRESVIVRGIEVPVFRETSFELALDAAKLEFGDLFNGYFMWKSNIYNLEGELVNVN